MLEAGDGEAGLKGEAGVDEGAGADDELVEEGVALTPLLEVAFWEEVVEFDVA